MCTLKQDALGLCRRTCNLGINSLRLAHAQGLSLRNELRVLADDGTEI